MKDIIKYISLFVLIIFSFYYTDKISNIIIYNSDLMEEILADKDNHESIAISAVINDNYIVPGINGLKVNELDSYYKMKKDYIYVAKKLVFEEVTPDISLENNKNLIIKNGNVNKKGVSIIINKNNNIINYIVDENIEASILIEYKDFQKNYPLEQINIDNNMDKLDILLNKYKLNTNICLVNDNNIKECQNKEKYLIEPTYYVDNVSVYGLEITSGDIVYISDDLSLNNFKILLKKIMYRDLDIVKLSTLISEKNISV